MLVETTARQSWRVFLDTVYTYTCYVIESDCVSLSTQVKSHLNLLNRKLISTCHLIHYFVIVYTLNVFIRLVNIEVSSIADSLSPLLF